MCGIIACFNQELAALEVYEGLLTLQHRGQDGTGFFHYDHRKAERNHFLLTGKEETQSVLEKLSFEEFKGSWAMGHTRYATIGSGAIEELQPQLMETKGCISCFAHNGNISNAKELRDELMRDGHSFKSQNDIEIVQHLFHKELLGKEITFETMEQSVAKIFQKAFGGYSVVAIIKNVGLIAFRDPKGIRPLVLGKKKKAYLLASESLTLDFLGYELLSNIEGGEFLFINLGGEIFRKKLVTTEKAHCFFEWVYFASPESIIENRAVYETRLRIGEILGERLQAMIEMGSLSADVVAPVPDTGRTAGLSIAEKLHLPYREILIKNRYIKRSFILPSQSSRERAIHFKYHPVKNQIEGKSILLVDDSVVRGSTAMHIIELIRKQGAKEITLVTTCPPILYPCFYGLNFPSQEELLAYRLDHAQMQKALKVDRLVFLTLEELSQALGKEGELCLACLNGHYPSP